MGNELEDFLKRAAQRRAEHVAVRGEQQERAKKQNQSLAPRAPEYTDRNRERAASVVDDDEEVYVAEVVPAELAGSPAFSSGTFSEFHTGKETDSAAVDRAYQPTSSQVPSNYETRSGWGEPGSRENSQAYKQPQTAGEKATAGALLNLLKSPMGVKQAFLMREILDRPSNRW